MKLLIALTVGIALLVPADALATTTTQATRKPTTSTALKTPPRRTVPGHRFDITSAGLYVPDYFTPTSSTNVLIFFHGGRWVAEQNFYDAHRNAVLITISFNQYAEYSKAFSNPKNLERIMNDVTRKLGDEGITSAPVGQIVLASFSGGYPAVREILASGALKDKVSGVLLADSLYPARLKDKPNEIDPDSIRPVAEFAGLAAAGKTTFWLTQLFPPEPKYRTNTTSVAADYLIRFTEVERRTTATTDTASSAPDDVPRVVLYRAEKGNMHILGYAGMTTQDHFEHFYHISELFEKSGLPKAR